MCGAMTNCGEEKLAQLTGTYDHQNCQNENTLPETYAAEGDHAT